MEIKLRESDDIPLQIASNCNTSESCLSKFQRNALLEDHHKSITGILHYPTQLLMNHSIRSVMPE